MGFSYDLLVLVHPETNDIYLSSPTSSVSVSVSVKVTMDPEEFSVPQNDGM